VQADEPCTVSAELPEGTVSDTVPLVGSHVAVPGGSVTEHVEAVTALNAACTSVCERLLALMLQSPPLLDTKVVTLLAFSVAVKPLAKLILVCAANAFDASVI
jgi:hypothetical protein